MCTALAISDDTTPTMRKTLSDLYLGYERQYWSIFRPFNLNEWTGILKFQCWRVFSTPLKTFPLTFINEANRILLL